MLTLCVLLEDALCTGCWYSAHWFYYLHIDVDAVWNSCWHCMHWLLIDTTSNVFWLIHVLSIEQEQIFSCLLVAVYSNKLFLLPLSPQPHVILHEGFTRSCRIHYFQKRQNLLPRGRRCPKARWGGKWESTRKPSTPMDLLIQIT